MAESRARVTTDRPGRYAKQLASHLGRRVETGWDAATGDGFARFPFGSGRFHAEDGALLLTVEGAEAELEQLEGVVGKHLVRFGAKDELLVEWVRDSGTPGTVWRNDEPDPEHHTPQH